MTQATLKTNDKKRKVRIEKHDFSAQVIFTGQSLVRTRRTIGTGQKFIQGKSQSKQNLEGLYGALTPGTYIKKSAQQNQQSMSWEKPMSQSATALVRNATQLENQTPLKLYADRRGPRKEEILPDKKIPSHK